ncbi:MAG: hypothetical protein ABI781_04995 [Burkholderiales bacterium]
MSLDAWSLLAALAVILLPLLLAGLLLSRPARGRRIDPPPSNRSNETP